MLGSASIKCFAPQPALYHFCAYNEWSRSSRFTSAGLNFPILIKLTSFSLQMSSQERVDAQIEGVKLLFGNQYDASEAHFAILADVDPGSAMGSGTTQ